VDTIRSVAHFLESIKNPGGSLRPGLQPGTPQRDRPGCQRCCPTQDWRRPRPTCRSCSLAAGPGWGLGNHPRGTHYWYPCWPGLPPCTAGGRSVREARRQITL